MLHESTVKATFKAKRGIEIACRRSVTLVDQDNIGPRLEILETRLIARTISPTPSLFAAQRPSPTLRGRWGNLGETRGGVGKSGVLDFPSFFE